VICCCRGNPVNIDIKSATARGIPVLHVPGRNAEGVAELALLLMLMLNRKIMQVAKAIRRSDASQDMNILSKIYFDYKGSEVWGKTIGIVGLGAVGRKVAELLKPFNVHLIAYDPYVDQEVMSQYGVKKVELTELMKQSDIVSLHVMPSETNKKMIGAQEIGMLKPSAYLVNTGRSAITDENAIYAALRNKKIAGAGLDVFDKEPIPFDHPFMSLDNVIILPHIGGNTFEVNAHQTEILLPELEKLLNGERPTLIINPEVLATFKFKVR
jgi:D-3-phosphoglycerate dehydrogenase